MDISNTISTIKKHPVIVLLLLFITVVVGAATFFSSVESIYSLAAKYLFAEESPEIRTASIELTPDEASDKGLELSYGHDDDREYALILKVNANFKTEKFNTPVYLNSVTELKVESTNSPENKMSLHRNYLQSSADINQMEWWTLLVFEKKPEASRVLSISLGTLRWDIPVGNQSWHPFQYKYGATQNRWHRAQGELELVLPNPTWPIVRSARLLETSVNNQSLLEVVIENRSEEPIPIETVVVSASHPKDPGTSCYSPDPKQNLTLNWGVITSVEKGESAWTELLDTNVKVPVRYNGRGRCSGFSFLAAVPVSSTINANAIGRVSLNIFELPPPTRRASKSSGISRFLAQHTGNAPQSVLRWLSLEIGVNASKTSRQVFPSIVDVVRDTNNEMLFDFKDDNLTRP